MSEIPYWMKDSEVIKVISTARLNTRFNMDGWVSHCGLVTLDGDGCRFSEFYRWELPEHEYGTPKGVDLFDFRTEQGRHVSIERYATFDEAAWALYAIFKAALNERSSPRDWSTEELMKASFDQIWEEVNAIELPEGPSGGKAESTTHTSHQS